MSVFRKNISTYLTLLFLFFSTYSYAEKEVEALFNQASEKFDQGEYEKTIDLMHQQLELSPNVSKYHHLLGKAYGRVAENASWLQAMSYAKKCLKSFQQAVLLDDENINALKDLKSYYESAPGFLGGSKKKAKAIESSLEQLEQSKQAQILQN